MNEKVAAAQAKYEALKVAEIKAREAAFALEPNFFGRLLEAQAHGWAAPALGHGAAAAFAEANELLAQREAAAKEVQAAKAQVAPGVQVRYPAGRGPWKYEA